MKGQNELLEKQQTASSADMMQALVVTSPRKFELKQVPLPEPADDEVRVRISGCGICASNIPLWEGRDWFEYPLKPGAPGHEGWGIIDKTGSAVTRFKTGDPVSVITYNSFAEYDIAGEANVVKLPDELSGKPFPGEPLGCAMNIFHRSDIEAGQTVAIVGMGFLGLLLTSIISGSGATVIAISRRESALNLAKENGAVHTIKFDDYWKIIDQVKKITGDKLCDRVIEATGKQLPIDLAGELTAVRGKLIIAGYHQDDKRSINMQLWNWKGIDVINAHERDPRIYIKGIEDAVEQIASGKLNPFHLYKTYTINEFDTAMEAIIYQPEGLVKALVIL